MPSFLLCDCSLGVKSVSYDTVCPSVSLGGDVVRSLEEVRGEERDVRQLRVVQPHAQRRVSDEEHAGG